MEQKLDHVSDITRLPAAEMVRTSAGRRGQPVQTAIAIGFWIGLFIFLAAYTAAALYSHTPLPLRLVTGTSMEPTLHAGDIIMLKEEHFSQIKTGDVVAYLSPDAVNARAAGKPDTILHRVIEVNKETGALVTKGDNSRVDPWPVTSDIVRGKQVLHIPAIGKPVLMLTNAKGIAVISILVLVGSLLSAALFYNVVPMKFPRTLRKSKPLRTR